MFPNNNKFQRRIVLLDVFLYLLTTLITCTVTEIIRHRRHF